MHTTKKYFAYFFLSNQPMNPYSSFAEEEKSYDSVAKLKTAAGKSLLTLNRDYGDSHKALIVLRDASGNLTKKYIGSANYDVVSWSKY